MLAHSARVLYGSNTDSACCFTTFIVTANTQDHAPDEILSRVDAFLTSFRDTLAAMPEEAFQQHVKSLIKRQLEPPKTMDSEFGLLYSEVSTRYCTL
jgi:secreted Zn-dependent insulinase-like peptidase